MKIMTERSSNIEYVMYENEQLTVAFKNGLKYEYQGVPQDVFDKLHQAESVGRFFSQNVRTKYPYKRLG